MKAPFSFIKPNGVAPVLDALVTDQGETLGVETIVLDGSGFTGASDVLFGATSATSFVVDSDRSSPCFFRSCTNTATIRSNTAFT